MNVLLLAILLQAADASGASAIAVQHEGRVKPFDTFSRQLMQSLTEKERFSGYSDPKTGERVEVFPGGDPVAALLKIVAKPADIHGLRFIKITHPELKKTFGLAEEQVYFSLADLEPARARFLAEAQEIDPEEATSQQRAVLKILHQFQTIEALYQERILRIVPVPFGDDRAWMTPVDVRRWLAGATESDPRSTEVKAALDAYTDGDPARRRLLQEAVEAWSAAVAAHGAGEGAGLAGVVDKLRAVNPAAYPAVDRIAIELRYNRVRPFHWASGVYFISALLFLLAFAFQSRGAWIAAVLVHGLGLILTGYGYALRWMIAGRYPLSNHYESMIMCAFGAAIIVAILELVLRSKNLVGLSGGLVASLLLVLANNVPTFAEQGFVAPLVPALQTVWMTIHVPIIMTGYAMGMLLAVLGHVHLVRTIARKTDPESDKSIDGIMYWILKFTVLFLLIGICLGAVWAGEAWGRPWGWDMKETWALITLLCYLAMLHARFLGLLRPFGTSLGAIASFQVLILTYYGVNFLFGKGLHTYGFGSGDWGYLLAFFALEAVFVAVALGLRQGRHEKVEPLAEAHDMPIEDSTQ